MTVTDTITIDEVNAAVLAAVTAAATTQAGTEAPVQGVHDNWGEAGLPVHVGQILTQTKYTELLRSHNTVGACHQRCAGAPGVGGYGYCVRETGHDPKLQHFVVGGDTGREVTWVWSNGLEGVDDTTEVVEKIDADDATVESYSVGMRVSKRDSRDVLVVLGAPKKRDEKVEILDLTHQRFRKIRKTLLVPVRDDDVEPTQEQMAWVAQFVADRRTNAYEIAEREVTNGRWRRPEMLASVAKIGIGEPPTRYAVAVGLNIELAVPGLDVSALDQTVLRDGIKAAILAAGKAMLPEGYRVKDVANFYVDGVREVR